MTARYLESSFLLSWLFGEPEAARVRKAVDEAEVVVTSALTLLETERAIARASAARLLKEADAQRLRGLVARHRASWITMAITGDVLGRAARAFPVEPVRTIDAIHLATALSFAAAFPELRVLTHDRRIADNAIAMGLA
jgi:uncharacterized protein with PIN domain